MAAPTSVDDYLAALPEAPRAALEKLRKQIRAAAPDAIETISYQMPTFKLDGRLLLSYAGFKNHCSLFPASDGVVEACGGELEALPVGERNDPFHDRQAAFLRAREEDHEGPDRGTHGAYTAQVRSTCLGERPLVAQLGWLLTRSPEPSSLGRHSGRWGGRSSRS